MHDPARLTVAVQRVGRRAVVAPTGDIDIATAGVLTAAINAAIDGAAAELWVDLTSVEFMDSTGLHVLVAARERLVPLHRRITVICPPGGPRRVIEMTGLAETLGLTSSRSSAQAES
jgi:anti-sigma B factor antagonist